MVIIFSINFEDYCNQVMIYLNAHEFLENSNRQPIVDVRSPSEFNHGHLPGAFNLPLFDDEERKRVGALYKNSGQEASVLLGLEIVGPKMAGFVKFMKKNIQGKDILVHCWRGGMRSKGMSWLFEMAGYNVSVLKGGYKSYRTYIRQKLGEPYNLIVLGGYTGSGKSEVLRFLKDMGEQVIDLEAIAHHKGSAFGDLGQENQPTNEQFENDVYQSLAIFDRNKPVWVEDESRSIGTVGIPDPFLFQMRESVVIFMDVERKFRVPKLVEEYAGYDAELLKKAILKISEKLGGLNTKLSVEALENNDFAKAIELVLAYYDKAYFSGMEKRNQSKVLNLKVSSLNAKENAIKLLEFCNGIL
jgi:tRNA 2-selenouridine synthase